MYVTTFYSFKGGVGRTFALVNTATALARTGRKVLVVDFDLEAPGIQTFDLLKPQKPTKGVVEFVSDYSMHGKTPDIGEYVYQATGEGVADAGGSLWVMPAGQGDSNYRRKLAGIHWQSLYREKDGFLMVEDMKSQWKQTINPDYVFIDSRTGHTDVEGICTRQLPDAVVLLFFPNEQNLVGLEEVVNDIRLVSTFAQSPPKLHFVISNVPELDDEEDILKRRVNRFRRVLDFRKSLTIRNYPSLALVDQCIFTVERPKSRLAREYGRLKDLITEHNMRDREAAIEFLKKGINPFGFHSEYAKKTTENRIDDIRKFHSEDGEILFLVSMLRRQEGRVEESLQLLDQAIGLGYRNGRAYIERATIRLHHGGWKESADTSEIAEDIRLALNMEELGDSGVERAVRLLGSKDESLLTMLAESPALQALSPSDRLPTVNALMRYSAGLPVAISVLKVILASDAIAREERNLAENQLVLCMIGDGDFQDAMEIISAKSNWPEDADISDVFNFAVCKWGVDRKIPVELFQRVLDLAAANEKKYSGANFAQCMALAYSCLDDGENTRIFADKAIERVGRAVEMELSCWRYRNVLPKVFVADCERIVESSADRSQLPLFLEQSNS